MRDGGAGEAHGERAEDHERGGEAVGTRGRDAQDDDRAGQDPDAEHPVTDGEAELAADVADAPDPPLDDRRGDTHEDPGGTADGVAQRRCAQRQRRDGDDQYQEDVKVGQGHGSAFVEGRGGAYGQGRSLWSIRPSGMRPPAAQARAAVPKVGSGNGRMMISEAVIARGAQPYTCATARAARSERSGRGPHDTRNRDFVTTL